VKKKRRPKEWWESYFDAQYLMEYEPIFTAERDRADVSRLIDLLGLPAGERILDVPCGQGRHAHLLAIARARGTGKHLRYVRGDMRSLPEQWTGRFAAVLNLFTSFGFVLDPAEDVRVVQEFARVLRPDGMLVWHGGSRDGVMARFLSRDWWKSADGTMVAHERTFDPLSGILTIRSHWSGKRASGEREHRIRLYTASRLAEICQQAGLIVEEAFDGWSRAPLSRRASEMLLVARKSELAG
jgi:SAM-dependent methyltransferase